MDFMNQKMIAITQQVSKFAPMRTELDRPVPPSHGGRPPAGGARRLRHSSSGIVWPAPARDRDPGSVRGLKGARRPVGL
ncbi:hypothetical protein GGTG_13749 [Gaeumannomyces tritici R3-111a-1]|uniref:Uncharacterized protein n=1 Tax=Gaeumannomyces tritici (strain R3-111a-1) TaxID=644352 RepID=J3PJR0_GAET3|nr:hypothetical protein GGTG_13749 [Gaeumannomyces tritici R3-111a-1]EJT68675.1 hypothetical protein GGTG_13749 [Gaeumannomyces tritici R3-111a-1]